MFIFTKKNKAKHEQTPLDIYFSLLEEAYGNLPIPSDDWAGIKNLLIEQYIKTYPQYRKNVNDEISWRIQKLEGAIGTIREHYFEVAKALNKQPKFG
ncbi:TPA: hypothetical protein DIU22_00835 [Candidatus Woesebacteria bacterium]|nr:MAG: hypothetical protein UR41_C0020G0009 [Candidatus Woesebacteria bacterium GW2011_GWA1_33_33]HCR35578.1 hypothetical protein [Candidatus Woesebacteria bacterium]